MCELFGINSATNIVANDKLKEFYSHSVKHPHGWGLAYKVNQNIVVEKEKKSAEKSEYLREFLDHKLSSSVVIGHIRYATIGNVERVNSHPFQTCDRNGNIWTLAHNGTIFDCDGLDSYFRAQIGETDSERILLYLVDKINEGLKEKGESLSFQERFQILGKAVKYMAKGNKVNLLIYDGEYYYVHTNHPGSLHFSKQEGAIFFSTVPLNEGEWEPICANRLLAYKDSKLVKKGRVHTHQYIPEPDKTKHLYQVFSGL